MITNRNKYKILFLTMFFFMGGVLWDGMWQLSFAKAVEKSITLSVSNQPLYSVLNQISNDTGYRILVDQKWADTPVSATLKDLPLEKGLKRLLKNFDHAIVFESDRTVRIIIYGQTGSSAGSSAGVPFNLPPVQRFEPGVQTDRPPTRRATTREEMPPKTKSGDQEDADSEENESENEADDDSGETPEDNTGQTE